MPTERQIIANVLDSEEMRLAILEEGRVAEIFCERMWETQKAGEIFKARVDSGEMKVAFALYPVSMRQLINIADSGKIMPPKTTWFEPKLRSGLAIHTLD